MIFLPLARSGDGTSILVKDVAEFSKRILPQYFKHSNFASFVRQLNFYGFTKAREEDIKIIDSNDAKYCQFMHENFRRENPELLVKIVRRIATHQNNGSQSDQGDALDSKIGKDCDEMEEEIASLKGKLNSMEDEMKKLSDMVSSVKIEVGIDGKDPGLEPKKTPHPIAGSNKKQKILLKDSQLFGTNLPSASQTIIIEEIKASPRSFIPLVAVSKHAASIDLPDLGLAVTNDADLFMVDKVSSTTNSRSSRSSSIDGNEPLSGFTAYQSEINGALAEVEQIISSLGSDLVSTVASASQDQSTPFAQDPLPALVLDDEGRDITLPALVLDEGHDMKPLLPVQQEGRASRNILDEEHLLNLEKSLATLPLQERVKFVQDITNNINGLDDSFKQGLTVGPKSDSDMGGRRKIETTSDLESLLFRVGLKIQCGQNQSTSSSRSSCAKRTRKKNKKDSSFVEIEA